MRVMRALASIENPLFSQASMSAGAAASSSQESLNQRINQYGDTISWPWLFSPATN